MPTAESHGTDSRPPIRLVLLLQDLEFGGTQRYAINLLKNLDNRVFRPELWVLRGGMDMVPAAREAGIDPFWLSRSPRFVGPGALIHLAWKLRRETPDILYTLTVVPNIWGRIFGTFAKVPAIISSYRDARPKQYESYMWPLSTRIICNAEAMRQEIGRRHSVNLGRVAVVPNAVDAELFSPDYTMKAPNPTVVFAGRLVGLKDPFTLLRGFKLTREHVPNARLEIYGNGPLRGKLEKAVRNLSLEGSVEVFPGSLDIRSTFRRAWAFAIVSRKEASPNVILEAMASELPVVATRVGGIPELVQDGRTGFLIEPGDCEGLANGLTRILQEQSLRHSMGKKARERVLEFHTMERMISATQQVLIEVAHGNGHGICHPA